MSSRPALLLYAKGRPTSRDVPPGGTDLCMEGWQARDESPFLWHFCFRSWETYGDQSDLPPVEDPNGSIHADGLLNQFGDLKFLTTAHVRQPIHARYTSGVCELAGVLLGKKNWSVLMHVSCCRRKVKGKSFEPRLLREQNI